MKTNWIDNSKHKPKEGDEYLVVWVLDDGDYPVTTSMDWDALKKVWTDPRCDDMERGDEVILYWMELPKPPEGIKKSLWSNEPLIELKDVPYGSCVHGYNLTTCDICNPF